MHEHLRHRLLGWWARQISRRPGVILAAAGAGAVLALVFTLVGLPPLVSPMGFLSDRNDLISRELEWNRRFITWVEDFEGNDDLTLAIDLGLLPDDPGYDQRLARAEQLADRLGRSLRQATLDDGGPMAERVHWRFRTDEASPRAMRMLLPMPEFEQVTGQIAGAIEQARPLLGARTAAGFIGSVADRFAGPDGAAADLADPDAAARGVGALTAMVRWFGRRLADPDADASLDQVVGQLMPYEPWQYLRSPNGRMLFVRIGPAVRPGSLNAAAEAIASIRQRIDEHLPDYPELDAGLTGIAVIEADETTAATWDSTLASLLAFGLIAATLITAFHSWRVPLLTLAALVCGIVWTYGFATLAVGHLQVISVIFNVLLLGLGVAFGIHLASRYELVRPRYRQGVEGFVRAIKDCFEKVGPGIVTGAITTSAAFCMTTLTDFTGVAEMGLIAAAGIVLCLLAMFTVFPSLLRLARHRASDVRPIEHRRFHFFQEAWVRVFTAKPVVTLACALALSVFCGWSIAAGWVGFDYNLLELLPKGAESVEWQRRIAKQGQLPAYSGASIVEDLPSAQRRARLFEAQPTVASVGGVGLLFPSDDQAKVQILNRLRAQLDAALPDDTTAPPPDPDALAAGLARLDNAASAASGLILLPQPLRRSLGGLASAARDARDTLAGLGGVESLRRVALLDRDFRALRGELVGMLGAALDTGALTLADLPEELRRLYVGGDGRMLLEIYPKLPPGVDDALDPQFLPGFIADMRRVDEGVTGVVVQIFESAELIKNTYLKAGALALVIVFVLVGVDFQRLDDAVLALVPVGMGFLITFGSMWVLGMSINPANIMVLPLLFGIGVDAGVHVLHRYRQDPVGSPPGLTDGTGKGIVITSLTTAIGFGALMIADHRGIASIGFVLALGVASTTLACMTVMPAWLTVRQRINQTRR